MLEELQGIIFLCSFFILSLVIVFFVLLQFKLNRTYFIFIAFMSVFFHFIGAVLYWKSTLNVFIDANKYFFQAANPPNYRLGTTSVIYLVHWLRYFIFGDSYLGVFSFFAMIGSIGSSLYMVLFHRLLKLISCKLNVYLSSSKIKLYSLFIVCWPSSMIWGSNLGKDPLVFFLIALFFLSLVEFRFNKISLYTLLISAISLFLIRPYLFLVGFISFIILSLFSMKKNTNFLVKISLLIVFIGIFIGLSGILIKFIGIDSFSYADISAKAIYEQASVARGTHIPVPTLEQSELIFFLPYLMFANFFFPLFFLIRNSLGILASVENMFLLYFFVLFLMEYNTWKFIFVKFSSIAYMFWFVISGILVLSMVNTNLGTAMREKMMYLPSLLIIMFVTFLLKKSKETQVDYLNNEIQ